MPDERTPAALHRWAFILTLWAEPQWRGCLETADGQRHYFRTLADLARVIGALSGWVEMTDEQTTSARSTR